MDIFTLNWCRSWLVRLFGRNELVRASDRLEAAGAAVAAVVVTLAIPIVAAVGTSLTDTWSAGYAQEALNRHPTTATALADARLHEHVHDQTFDVKARWSAEDGIHVDTVDVPDVVRRGDRFEIWVDDRGNHTGPPPPPSRAATEALGWTALTWMALAATMVAAVTGLRRRLECGRHADWDRALEALAGNDGGRANH